MTNTVRFLIVALCFLANADAQQFKKGGTYSPYGPPNPDVREALAQSSDDPKSLHQFKDRPLEDTFDGLATIWLNRTNGTPLEKRFADIAQEVLLGHPDFENFMQKILRRKTELSTKGREFPLLENGQLDIEKSLEIPPTDLSPADRQDSEILLEVWPNLLGVVRNIPSMELRIRLMGPCLKGAVGWAPDAEGHILYDTANEAASAISTAVKNLTGEQIPTYRNGHGTDVAAAREWWAKNEHKFAWTPPSSNGPRPANMHQNKPHGNRFAPAGNPPSKAINPETAPLAATNSATGTVSHGSSGAMRIAAFVILGAAVLTFWLTRNSAK